MITDDYKQFGLEAPLREGEQKIISKGKNGFVATGCLEYYSDDVLIKTKQIRKNTYYPTKEVVLVSSIEPEKKHSEMSESKGNDMI